MDQSELLAVLTGLEQRLHEPDVRADSARLGSLLHPEFSEVGACGRCYTRDEVLAEFHGAPPSYAIHASDFATELIAEDLALLRYRSAHVDPDGRLSRHVERSSLWQHSRDGWRLRFHQGTPVTAGT